MKACDNVNRKVLLERLKQLGIMAFVLKNIESIQWMKNGYLDPVSSTLGLKQGCPLSPMLFNLYTDDIEDTFDKKCVPVSVAQLMLVRAKLLFSIKPGD